METQVQTVAEAEAALKAARDAALEKRVADAKAQLKQVRAEAKQLRAEYAAVARQLAEADGVVATGRSELYAIDARIAQLSAPLPDMLAEPEDFSGEIQDLRTYRAEVLQKMEEAQQRGPRRDRQAEIVLALQRLECTAKNLANLIAHGGRMVNGPEGGLSRV